MGKQPLLLVVGITSEYKVGTGFSLNFNAYIIKLTLKRHKPDKRCQDTNFFLKSKISWGYPDSPIMTVNSSTEQE